MKNNKVKILNIEINNLTMKELLNKLESGVVITPNIDHLITLQNDFDFYKIYKKAEYVVCDSQILYFISKLLRTDLKERISGSDLLPNFYNYHAKNENIKIYLLGADIGVAEKAGELINKKVGRNMVVGTYSPSYGFEKNEDECLKIVDDINKSEATVLAVGVGAPKQEKWIYKYKNSLKNVKIFLGIGATLDFESGNIKRSPKFLTNIGFEWLYRLIREPKRLWKRYLIKDIKFFVLITKQIFKIYENPWEK